MSLSSLQLDAFYEVSQKRSFSEAAQALGVTQSALSQRVLNLESEVGTTLFIRNPAGLQLTESGQGLLRYCRTRAALENGYLSSLKAGNASELAGVVRIAGFSSVMRSLVIPALGPLMRKNERLSVKMMTAELHELESLLRHAQADYLITPREPGREGIEAVFLGREENVLVKSKRFSERAIYLDHDERDATTDAYFKLAKRRPRNVRRRYLDDVYGLIDGVRAGYGISVLPKHLIAGESDFTILRPATRLMVPVYLVFHAQPYYTPVHQAVTESIVRYFKSRLAP